MNSPLSNEDKGKSVARIVEEPEEKLVEIQVQEGLFNGMTPEQLLEWLDKRCGFNSFQKDYVHMILIKMIKAKVTKKDSEVEDQEELLQELITDYVTAESVKSFMKNAPKKFSITRIKQ